MFIFGFLANKFADHCHIRMCLSPLFVMSVEKKIAKRRIVLSPWYGVESCQMKMYVESWLSLTTGVSLAVRDD
ncbi:hypothetical protein TNCV_1138451 [Trichonephila clavipes]|nr:hypothetical protein TNCV_1138451 [Trichonephila clavipes]